MKLKKNENKMKKNIQTKQNQIKRKRTPCFFGID